MKPLLLSGLLLLCCFGNPFAQPGPATKTYTYLIFHKLAHSLTIADALPVEGEWKAINQAAVDEGKLIDWHIMVKQFSSNPNTSEYDCGRFYETTRSNGRLGPCGSVAETGRNRADRAETAGGWSFSALMVPNGSEKGYGFAIARPMPNPIILTEMSDSKLVKQVARTFDVVRQEIFRFEQFTTRPTAAK